MCRRLRAPAGALSRAALAGVILGVVGCAPDIETLRARLAPHYRMQQPPGAGPFPAVLLVPDCAGIGPARLRIAAELVGRGYIVVFVDYASARGLQGACRDEVSPDEIAGDIRVASAHLRSLRHVRSGAVGAIGWSLGGAGVLASLAGSELERQPPLDAAAVLYPVCRGVRPWKTSVPILVLLAGLDDVAPPAVCEDLILRSAGRAEIRTYSDAGHSFDVSDLPRSVASQAPGGRAVGFHAEAARQAWSEVLTHLQVRLP